MIAKSIIVPKRQRPNTIEIGPKEVNRTLINKKDVPQIRLKPIKTANNLPIPLNSFSFISYIYSFKTLNLLQVNVNLYQL
jgi:hypothetical protein